MYRPLAQVLGRRLWQHAFPGDRVLVFETGHFSQLWAQLAQKMGFQVEYVPGNWRAGAAPGELESQ